MEGLCDFSEVPDEPLVEVTESNEFLDPLYLGGWLPFADCITLILIHPEPISGEFYSQEVNLVFVELAFFGVEEDFGLLA